MTRSEMTVGEALVVLLEQAGVDTVFGIPGVHTIELYRGLGNSRIRHITPRHEQGAGFMADGYARATGKPGVCLLITGPGFTNAITAMAQARADSIPMLVITGVNRRDSLGKGLGHLHELPDQAAMSRTIALWTHTLNDPARLGEMLAEAWGVMMGGRPGPVHLEIPTDVMGMRIALPDFALPVPARPAPDAAQVAQLAARATAATRPLILAGGGTGGEAAALRALATAMDAPVVSTINARGAMAGHLLDIPAAPDLVVIREMVAEADLVLAIGTELGPTDYDCYGRGAHGFAGKLVRVDIDAAQLARGPEAVLAIEADAGAFMTALVEALSPRVPGDGAARAEAARLASWEEIGPRYRSLVGLVEHIWQVLPEATIVGDSTQIIYASNLYVEAPGPGVWFNSSCGFGTLGYAAPAAIGAALGRSGPAVCIIGDGGMQFTLAELGSARDCAADVAFIVWNNAGYQEIETWMNEANVPPVGVTPSAPDFVQVAAAYGLPARRVADGEAMAAALAELPRPCVIEFVEVV